MQLVCTFSLPRALACGRFWAQLNVVFGECFLRVFDSWSPVVDQLFFGCQPEGLTTEQVLFPPSPTPPPVSLHDTV